MLEIVQIPCWVDNYAYLLADRATGQVALVDAPEADPIRKVLQARGWKLSALLNTHHHSDHIGANEALLGDSPMRVAAHASDRSRIPGFNEPLEDGQDVRLGASRAQVLFVPGHTSGHIAYWFEEDRALFCGDTLFVAGCGRLFEGTAEQMRRSLERLRALPDDTRVFCAHEYTAANLRFALAADPDNEAVRRKTEWAARRQARGESTVPSTMAEERITNPFLRWDDPRLIAAVNDGHPGTGDEPAAVFAVLRRWKDGF